VVIVLLRPSQTAFGSSRNHQARSLGHRFSAPSIALVTLGLEGLRLACGEFLKAMDVDAGEVDRVPSRVIPLLISRYQKTTSWTLQERLLAKPNGDDVVLEGSV
jgi:hypothetical protein